MRYKFRAWDITDKVMKPVLNLFISEDMVQCDEDEYSVYNASNFKLMQYTDKLDTNNVEIYEGDIVTDIDYEDVGITGQVVYKLSAFYIEWDSKYPPSLLQIGTPIVVGNIYENPELLEK